MLSNRIASQSDEVSGGGVGDSGLLESAKLSRASWYRSLILAQWSQVNLSKFEASLVHIVSSRIAKPLSQKKKKCFNYASQLLSIAIINNHMDVEEGITEVKKMAFMVSYSFATLHCASVVPTEHRSQTQGP